MRGIHCLKMLFGVNLELLLNILLIYLIFQSFCQLNTSVGRYQSHLWPTSPFNILTLFILFLFYMCCFYYLLQDINKFDLI